MNKPISESTPSLLVAFASSEGRAVDQHFGSTIGLTIHRIDTTRTILVESTRFPMAPQNGNEDKLVARLEKLKGCDALYCQRVGGSAFRQLLGQGVQPLMVEGQPLVAELLEGLQEQLTDVKEVWVERALQRAAGRPETSTQHLEAALEEEWSE